MSTTLPPRPTPLPVAGVPHAHDTLAETLPDAPPAAPSAAPRARRERLVSLDVFRGMTVAGMLLVNNPGTWSAIYPPLEHAEWHGWTPTDLVFPFFLFIVGITTHLSLSPRIARGDDTGAVVRQILRRGGLIFLIGFSMSAFPGWQWGPPAAWPFPAPTLHPTFWDRFVFRWEHVRILGVLQRIGLAYIISALLTLRTTLKQQIVIIATALYGYWIAMALVRIPGFDVSVMPWDLKDGNLEAWLDRAVLGTNHMFTGSRVFDPEGLLSTIPAACTAMLGVIAGRWIGSGRPLLDRIAGLFTGGALGMAAGLVWNWVFPINKSIWTSSYVLFTAGMAAVVLGICMYLVDARGVRRFTSPFVIYGVNPMAAFVGSGVLARLIYSIWHVTYDGKWVPLEEAIYRTLFASWASPVNASLLFALSFVLLWLGVLTVLYRRNIVLKV